MYLLHDYVSFTFDYFSLIFGMVKIMIGKASPCIFYMGAFRRSRKASQFKSLFLFLFYYK